MTGLQFGLLIWVFVLGCAVGSFLNVCIWRLPRGLAIHAPPRSICPICRTAILWRDNIPLVSFLALGRKCRACGGPISWRYPAVEALTGLVFALIYYRQGVQMGTDAGQLAMMMLLAGLLICGSAVDVDWLIIPDEVSLSGILGGLFGGLLLPQLHVGQASYHTFSGAGVGGNVGGLAGSAIGAIAGGGVVLACALLGYLLLRKEAMGIGDAKMLAMIGAFFGWKVAVVAFFLSPFIGLLYGVPMLVMKGEHVMPYGPFLGLAAVITVVFRTSLCARLEPLETLWQMVF
jgi:leader peptidase (prepilin peptidase)/N-methyltransferase